MIGKISRIAALLFPFLLLTIHFVQVQIFQQHQASKSIRSMLNGQELFSYLLLLVLAFILVFLVHRKKISLAFQALFLYLVYRGIAHCLEWARNFNNADYDVWNVAENTLFQTPILPAVLFFIGAVLLLYYVVKLPLVERQLLPWSTKKDRIFIGKLYLSQLCSILVLTDSKAVSILMDTTWLSGRLYDTHYLWLSAQVIACLWGMMSIASYLCVDACYELRGNRSSYSLAFTTSLLFAGVFNFFIQYSIAQPIELLGYHLFQGAQAFQIGIFFLVIFAIYLLFNRYLLTTLLIATTGTIFIVANGLKFSLRNEPILPSDLIWLMDPRTLFSFVDISYLFLAILLLLVMAVFYHFARQKLLRGKISRLPVRLLSLGIIIYLLSGVYTTFTHKKKGKIAEEIPVLSILNNFNDISWFGNTVNSQLRSLAFVWYKQVTTEVIDMPEGYSAARMRTIESKYRDLANTINKTRTESLEDQTVIYILSESFSNPNRVPHVVSPVDIVPYIDSIKEKYTSGLMHSDGYGGGTANMEFQTLMGLPFYNLSPNVSTIYTEVVPKMDYLPSISQYFKPENRIAIHLENDYNYSRNVIYQRLDFAKFISKKDIKKYGAFNVGLYPSDQSTYDIILKNIQEKESQFFSVMTMQNHVPWRVGEPENINVRVNEFTDEENAELMFYSRLLTHTDTATKNFLESLSQIDKKITVVFYGDHLPGLYANWMFEEHPESQYQTDYFIWSNYPTPKLNYPLVNSSDFAAELLAHTNSKVSPYYALLTQVLNQASVAHQENLSPEGKKIAEDLKLVEYDLISGDGYLENSDFFKIKEK